MDEEKKKKRKICIIALASALGVLLAAAGIYFFVSGIKKPKSEHLLAEDVSFLPAEREEETEGGGEKAEEKKQGQLFWEMVPEDQEKLKALREVNKECVGIIRIKDTVLDHPIMLSGSEEDYYLRRDINGNSNSHGVPFLTWDSQLELNSGKSIIYGHNIRKNTRDVFCDLAYYEELDYYREHPVIDVITTNGTCHYLIFAYFLVDTSDKNDNFVYWDMLKFQSKEGYFEYMEDVQKRNWLNVPAAPSFSDNLLVLSSCSVELSGSGTNRMVVMAKRIAGDFDVQDAVSRAKMNENPLLPEKLRKKK